MSESEEARRDRTLFLAALYGLYLRGQGHSPQEAAKRVARRYWSARDKLAPLLRQRPSREVNQNLIQMERLDADRFDCTD